MPTKERMEEFEQNIEQNEETPKITSRTVSWQNPVTGLHEMFGPMIITKPDSVQVEVDHVVFHQDGFPHLRKDGFTISYNAETRFYTWAIPREEGGIKASDYPIHLYDPEELGLQRYMLWSEEQIKNTRPGSVPRGSGERDQLNNNTLSWTECPSEGIIQSPINILLKFGLIISPNKVLDKNG